VPVAPAHKVVERPLGVLKVKLAGAKTMKEEAVVAVPVEVVTVIVPVVAEAGTIALTLVLVFEVTTASIPLKRTAAEPKFEPEIVTVSFTKPEEGVNAVITGDVRTVKLPAEVAVPIVP